MRSASGYFVVIALQMCAIAYLVIAWDTCRKSNPIIKAQCAEIPGRVAISSVVDLVNNKFHCYYEAERDVKKNRR